MYLETSCTKYPYRQIFACFICNSDWSETRRRFTHVACQFCFTIDQKDVLKKTAGLRLNVKYQYVVQGQVLTLCLLGNSAAPKTQNILLIVQRDATQNSLFIILQVQSTCFQVSTTPVIRSTQNCNYSLQYRSHFLYNYLPPTWPSLATLGGCTLQSIGAVVTVLCTSDDGCGWHPKTCRVNFQTIL